MKKTILLLLLAPFIVHAQLMPTPIQGYQDPNDQNKPLDPAYIPGKIYRVDFYSLAANQSDMEQTSHYLIETDDNFMLRKQSQYIDNATETTKYNKYVTDYTYTNTKLNCITRSLQKTNSNVLLTSTIDSIFYSGNLISIKDRWDISIDSGTIQHDIGTEYLYDSLNRFTETKPYNLLVIQPNTMYGGYYKIDSFSNTNKMARILPYFVSNPIDTIHQNNHYTLVYYDSLNRVSIITSFSKPFPDMGFFRSDSIVYYYTANKQYPDSTLDFNSGVTSPISEKKIFTYTASGTISEISSYRKQGADFILSGKEVYTPLLSSSVAEKEGLSKQFQIMPNPNQGSFRLVLTDGSTDCTVSIVNILGEEVYKQQYKTISEVSIEANLQPGIYIVNTNTPSGLLSKKLVIH